MVRHMMNQLGQYHGPAVRLYDADGEGIQDRRHIENVLSRWKVIYEDEGKRNPYAGSGPLWIVPADVHW